jgi:hypothetical protein
MPLHVNSACLPHAPCCAAACLQIFLAQMGLETKHSEIAKLEQRAQQREEALTVSACLHMAANVFWGK